MNLLVLYVTQRVKLLGDKGSQFTVVCSQEPRHVGLSSELLPHNMPTECITHKKNAACSSELLLSPTTKRHNPDAHKKTASIEHNYTTIFPQKIFKCNMTSEFTNKLRTSHICLLIISTHLSQTASMLAQHSQ
jgi:hypothetical protein